MTKDQNQTSVFQLVKQIADHVGSDDLQELPYTLYTLINARKFLVDNALRFPTRENDQTLDDVLSPFASRDDLQAAAVKAIEEHGNNTWHTYRTYYDHWGGADTLDDIDDRILCLIRREADDHGDQRALAYCLIESLGGIGEIDRQTLADYFDYSAYGRDLILSGDYTLVDDGNGRNIVIWNY